MLIAKKNDNSFDDASGCAIVKEGMEKLDCRKRNIQIDIFHIVLPFCLSFLAI